jgi:hypothetical protein
MGGTEIQLDVQSGGRGIYVVDFVHYVDEAICVSFCEGFLLDLGLGGWGWLGSGANEGNECEGEDGEGETHGDGFSFCVWERNSCFMERNIWAILSAI